MLQMVKEELILTTLYAEPIIIIHQILFVDYILHRLYESVKLSKSKKYNICI